MVAGNGLAEVLYRRLLSGRLTSLEWLVIHTEEDVHGLLLGLGGCAVACSACSLVDVEEGLCVFVEDLLVDELVLLVDAPELVLDCRRDRLWALI